MMKRDNMVGKKKSKSIMGIREVEAETISFTISPTIKKNLEAFCKIRGISLNTFIQRDFVNYAFTLWHDLGIVEGKNLKEQYEQSLEYQKQTGKQQEQSQEYKNETSKILKNRKY